MIFMGASYGNVRNPAICQVVKSSPAHLWWNAPSGLHSLWGRSPREAQIPARVAVPHFANPLFDTAVGQPLSKEFLGPIGPPSALVP